MNNKLVVSSLIYKFTERFLVKIVGLVIGIILARLLLPEDFGQVAIITVFINLANVFIQNGFSLSLVQKKEVDEIDYSTALIITFFITFIIVFLLWILAPLISVFYDVPFLEWPIRIYSLSLFFGAINSVQVAKNQREMNFRRILYSSFIATILSGIIGIAMAFCNFGIWALVAYGSLSVFFSFLVLLIMDKWIPCKYFSLSRAKNLFSFGWKMLVSGFLCSIYSDIRSLIIGKKYSNEILGYYDKGQQYPLVISQSLDNSIQSVMFSTISKVQDDKHLMKLYLKKSIQNGAFIITPIMVGFAMIAEAFVIVVLTDKWLPSVIFIQIVCFAEINMPFVSSCLTSIKSSGRSDVYMKLEIVRRIVMIVGLIISVVFFDSVVAIAISYLILAYIDILITLIPTKRITGYGLKDMIKDNWKTMVCSLVMGAVVYFVGYLNINKILLLVLQILCGVIVFFISSMLLKSECLAYLFKVIKSFIKKKEVNK